MCCQIERHSEKFVHKFADVRARRVFLLASAAQSPTDAGPEVLVQLVSLVTGADGPAGGVLAVVRTAAVVVLAAVDDLHLDP